MKTTASRAALLVHVRNTWVACLTPKGCGRLVQNEDSRAEVYAPGDGKRLAFAAGQAADQPVAVGDPGDAHVLHEALDRDGVRTLAIIDLERPPALRQGSTPTKNDRPMER